MYTINDQLQAIEIPNKEANRLIKQHTAQINKIKTRSIKIT